MDHRISQDDESRMTGAIEKAAMLASCKDNCNINKTLADCLLEKKVDSRFAKTASAAFNRRLTVLKFQKTDDDHRGETFGLSDADTVFELMGGKPVGQSKTASETVTVFKMEMVSVDTPMAKTAAENRKPSYIRYEERTKVPVFERHVESIMDKQASLFMRMTGDLKGMEDALRRRKNEAAWELVKTADEDPFAYQTLCNVFGERLSAVLGESMPVNMKLEKKANAVDPETPLSRKIAKLLEDNDAYVAFNDTLCDYKEWLGGFAKAAADVSKELHKQAGIGNALIGGALRHGTAAGLDAVQMVNQWREGADTALSTGFSNVNNILKLVPVTDMAPAEILTPDFIARDRMHDRMLAISDVMADPYIATYPAEQQFAAANRVMDLHPIMESAENRELLKTQVGDLLMRNNRNGMADLSAYYTTLASIGKAPESETQKAVEAVKALNKTTAPEHLDLGSLVSGLDTKLNLDSKTLASNLRSEANKELAEALKERKSDAETAAKNTSEESKGKREKNEAVAKLISGRNSPLPYAQRWTAELEPDGRLVYVQPAAAAAALGAAPLRIPFDQLAEHFKA